MQTGPWWLNTCLDNIKKIGGTPCPDQTCTGMRERYLFEICNCEPPYTNGCTGPNRTPNCCAYTASSPVPAFSNNGICYCCCGNIGYLPMLAVAEDQAKANYELNVGDPVLAASDASLRSWTQLPVAFSSGIGPDAAHSLIRIRYGEQAAPDAVLAGRNQVFLLSDGKLKRASRLAPGKDELVRPDGKPVPIIDMTTHAPAQGVHQIATSTGPATGIGGHLVIVNGVVSGDYALELADLEGKLPHALAPGHAGLPEFGSEAYARHHKVN